MCISLKLQNDPGAEYVLLFYVMANYEFNYI